MESLAMTLTRAGRRSVAGAARVPMGSQEEMTMSNEKGWFPSLGSDFVSSGNTVRSDKADYKNKLIGDDCWGRTGPWSADLMAKNHHPKAHYAGAAAIWVIEKWLFIVGPEFLGRYTG